MELPQECDCSLYGGPAHLVRTMAGWRRHRAHKQLEALQQLRQQPPDVPVFDEVAEFSEEDDAQGILAASTDELDLAQPFNLEFEATNPAPLDCESEEEDDFDIFWFPLDSQSESESEDEEDPLAASALRLGYVSDNDEDLDLSYSDEQRQGYTPAVEEDEEVEEKEDAGTVAAVRPEGEFDYRNPSSEPLTGREMVSMVLQDISQTYLIPREAAGEIRRLITWATSLNTTSTASEDSQITPPGKNEFKPMDPRTLLKRMTLRTGLDQAMYDCCRNSCMAFTLNTTAEVCSYCGEARYHPGTGKAVAQFAYIPVIHRLRLMWSDKAKANEMLEYRWNVEQMGKADEDGPPLRSDFWTGQLCRDLKEKKGLFSKLMDMGLSLSTDGVKVFKTRSAFNIWPLMLVNLNLPPSVRYRRKNLLIVGFIPGPRNPKDLNSYLQPLIAEFIQLQQGIVTFNAATNSEFKLFAHIVVVTADMPGREKLMYLKGNRAYQYCPYCMARGIWKAAVYCPCEPPLK
jgi:hypothetical protein